MSQTIKPFDGKLVTNTLAGLHMQTAITTGIPMVYKEKSTVNEHLEINGQKKPDANDKPEMRFLVVGNKGHEVSDVTNGLITPMPIRHQPTDAAPYGIQPLVLRPLDNDVTDAEREKLFFRKQEEHKGRQYWAYYGYKLDFRSQLVQDFYTQVRDGVTDVDEFEYSDLNLYPKPSTMPDYNYEVTDQVVEDDGDYVHTSATLPIPFDEWLVNEAMNVANILHGDPRYAIISELCLCHGIESTVSVPSATGSPFMMDEVIGCQVSVFVTTFVNLSFNNKGIAYDVNFGQTEPMPLAPGQVPTASTSAVNV